MNDQYREFGMRVRRIDRAHRKLADGYVAKLNDDGLLVAAPKRRFVRVPFAGLALVAVGIVVFKAIVLSQLGPQTYESRVAKLSAGSTVERVGAWMMQADPLTVWVADRFSALPR